MCRAACSSGGRGEPSSIRKRGRSLRATRGCSEGAASRQARSRGRARVSGRRRSRTASKTGGTCRWSGRAPRRSPAKARRGRRRRGTSGGHLRLREHLVDPLAEPVEAVRIDRLGQAGTDDQDVVVAGRHAIEAVVPRLAELPLDAVALDGAADRLRHREAKTGRGLLLLWKPVEDEKARRDRASVTVDGVEI